MSSERLEKLKKARSLNDVMDVLSGIGADVKANKAIVSRLIESTSAADDEIVFDRRETDRNPAARVAPKELVKFTKPKAAELQKHTKVISDLHDNYTELEAAEALIKQAFAGNKKQPAALKAVRDLMAEVENSLNDAFDAVGEIAEKHQPAKVTSVVDALVERLISALPANTYEDILKETYVVPSAADPKSLQFCNYISVLKLKNSQGFVFDQYYFVLTATLGPDGALTYNFNSFPNFKVPGKYPLGKEVPTKDGINRRLDFMLAHNNFVTEHGKLPFPADDDRVKHSGMTTIKGVKSAAVKDDNLTVTLEPTVKSKAAIDEVIKSVMARLSSLFRKNVKNTHFAYKVGRSGSSATLKFSLMPTGENKDADAHVDMNRLQEFSDALGLTDSQKKALRFALQN